LRKIHAEITQIANQRFLLTTAAITIFGVITAWMIPKEAPHMGDPVGGFSFFVATILCVLISALYGFSYILLAVQRIFTTYLVESEASEWEQAWKRFRKIQYFGYTKAITLIFIVLIAIAASLPFIFKEIYELRVEPMAGAITLVTIGSSGILLIATVGFLNLFDPEPSAAERWKKLKSEEE
jgi:hypothetical protein